jgi:hypothetical protein
LLIINRKAAEALDAPGSFQETKQMELFYPCGVRSAAICGALPEILPICITKVGMKSLSFRLEICLKDAGRLH